jgi:hypothetical protein
MQLARRAGGSALATSPLHALVPFRERSVDRHRWCHDNWCCGEVFVEDERATQETQAHENLEHRPFLTSTPKEMKIKYKCNNPLCQLCLL